MLSVLGAYEQRTVMGSTPFAIAESMLDAISLRSLMLNQKYEKIEDRNTMHKQIRPVMITDCIDFVSILISYTL